MKNKANYLQFYCTCPIDKFESSIKRALGPNGANKTQALCIYKSPKVIIIGKDKDLIFVIFKVIPPSLNTLIMAKNSSL